MQVVIRFSPSVAKRAAETRWHPCQELEPQEDGSSDLARPGRRACARSKIWILGWGADAEVLEPAELSQRSQRNCRAPPPNTPELPRVNH